jgi:hypothetical protein
MSATHRRSGGSHSESFALRRTEPDDVARPSCADRPFTAEELAAQPQLQLLQVDAACDLSGRAATNLASFDWNDHENFRHASDGLFGRGTSRESCVEPLEGATSIGTSKSVTKVLAALATAAWLTGCSTAKSPDHCGGNCLQAAAGQSFQAPAPDDVSTEGGGLGHFDGRARDVVPVPVVSKTVGAGGAASNQESSGTGRAVRDRSGLVDAWPEAGPPKSHLTTWTGLSKG